VYKKHQHIHFVGIAGIGMSGIAELLINMEHRITGSDLRETELTQRLTKLGAKIYYGHSADYVAGADVVVISSAVPRDNPEVVAAREQAIPVIPRAEMLAELMRLKHAVVVAGSHGKTTTTSLVGTILNSAGFDPTLVIGGRLGSIGSNARLGDGDFLVAEADESDGTFLLFSPTIAIVTNIDHEHLDYYGDMTHLKEAFLTFINSLPYYGLAVLCLDDPNVQSLLPNLKKRYLTYGFSAQADVQAVNLSSEGMETKYDLIFKGKNLGRVTFNMPGRYNILNSLAAAGVALELEVPFEVLAESLSQVGVIHRRFEIKGEEEGVLVIDDYGHHPTEIKATLAALSSCFPQRRTVVVFQPHRFSRVESLFDDFTTAFNQADRLIMTEIYPAGEKPVEGINGRVLFEAVKSHGHHEVEFVPDFDVLAQEVARELTPGDVVVTLGAGSITQIGDQILRLLKDGADN